MKDHLGHNHYAVAPFTEPPGEAPDESAEMAIWQFMARYNLNYAVCLEMIDEVVKIFGGRQAMADDEAVRRLQARHRLAWHLLISYQDRQKTAREVRMSTRAMALELGFNTAAGAEGPASIGRQTGCSKQTVNKCAAVFQTKLGLPPREGQRDGHAREAMTAARLNQLKHSK